MSTQGHRSSTPHVFTTQSFQSRECHLKTQVIDATLNATSSMSPSIPHVALQVSCNIYWRYSSSTSSFSPRDSECSSTCTVKFLRFTVFKLVLVPSTSSRSCLHQLYSLVSGPFQVLYPPVGFLDPSMSLRCHGRRKARHLMVRVPPRSFERADVSSKHTIAYGKSINPQSARAHKADRS